MRFYRMTVAYDGTEYAGWQRQPDQPTIQGTIESAIERITGSHVGIIASGRTDAGVHALGQVVSFACGTRLTPEVLCRAVNANTPEDIYVVQVQLAPSGFHAIRDALAKRYRYRIQNGPHRDLFTRTISWYVPRPLDVDAMRAAAKYLVGKHDFRSFEAAGAPRKTTVRTILDLSVETSTQYDCRSIAIDVEADGFLYNMVRNIVGSLVLVGQGERPPAWIAEVLAGRDRTQAGPTAPARGLMLMLVRYE